MPSLFTLASSSLIPLHSTTSFQHNKPSRSQPHVIMSAVARNMLTPHLSHHHAPRLASTMIIMTNTLKDLSGCTTCNAYALHISQGMALSKAGLTPAIFNLMDKAACIVCHSPYDDDKINELHCTCPAPTLVEQEAWDFKCAQVVSLGGPDHHILNQPGAGPSMSHMALPAATFVSGGRVQVKLAGSHVLREQPSSQHGWPHHPPTEDVMMTDHAVSFLDIPSDVQMTLNAGAPSVPAQGTMFPEFDGMEWPHCMLSLGEGSDGKNKILFMRINNNLYAYEGEKIDSVKHNLRLHVIPPVLMGKRLYDDIPQLYVRALQEPEDKAPCIQKVQDLITYLNLWKKCKLGSNEVINLALSRWKPPAWSSKKSCKRREALKEKGKVAQPQGEEEQASSVGIPPPTFGLSGGAPALQEQIADAPSGLNPAPNVGLTPTPVLINCMRLNRSLNKGLGQAPKLSPPRGHNLFARQKGPSPLVGSLGAFLSYHQNAPPLDSSIEAWREFIDKEQRCPPWGEDRVLGTSSRPDDSDAEANPLSLRNIQGFLLYKCLVPVPQSHRARNVWMCKLACLLAKSAQSKAHHIPGTCVNGIIANGGENIPQVMAKIEPLRKALTKPCPPSDVGSREWYECQAQAIGFTINQVPPGHMPLQADNQQIISMFTSVVFICDLPHCPCGGASTVRGNPPAKGSEPEEGKMTDNLFEDKDRS
ncbi:hypothetical protein BKA82DRAFT_4018732 [Pisolithus tinctorius]|nr:hypothetical protein BKA82DRAFT_4018732 [Pisolithus tinctorius]